MRNEEERDFEIGSPRLTATGILALWAGLLFTVTGVLRYDGSMIWLGTLAFLMIAVSRWWSVRNLRGLVVRRQRPSRVFAGEPFELKLTIEKEDAEFPSLPIVGIGVSVRDVLLSRRAAGLWMGGGLRGNNRAEGILRTRRFRRGRESRTDVKFRSRFPLGFFEVMARGHLIDENSKTDGGLVVYPQPWLPDELRRDLRLSRFDVSFPHGIDPDPGEEFRGVRAYRSGDPVKAVHWPATARAGSLMVREWDPPAPRPQRYGLILHTLERESRLLRPDRWEMALRMATGLTAHCREAGISLWFAEETGATQHPLLRIPEQAAFEMMLERLALVQRTTLRDPDRLRAAIGSLGEICDRIYLISDVPLEQWRPIIQQKSGQCPVVCVDAESVVPMQRKLSVTSKARNRNDSERSAATRPG